MRKLFYISIFTVILLLAGCIKAVVEEPVVKPAPVGQEQLLLTASSTALVTKTETGTEPDLGPELLPDGLKVGIYVNEDDAGEGVLPLATNKIYVSKEGLLTAEDLSQVFLASGKNFSVLGYAPNKKFGAGGHTAVPFIHGEDVLLSSVETIFNVSPERNSVSLPFEHKTVKIQFIVQIKFPDESIKEDVPIGTSIEVTGFDLNATLDLTTGLLTPVVGEVETISSSSKQNAIAKYVLETTPTCFFLPMDGQKALSITVVYNGKALPPVSLSRSWTIGTSYVYKISIKEQFSEATIQIENVTIIDWVEKIEDDFIITY